VGKVVPVGETGPVLSLAPRSPAVSLRETARNVVGPLDRTYSVAGALRTTARACCLLAALGLLVVATGYPYLFPSLGPSAYALAVNPAAATSRPRRVVGGHLLGLLGGLVAYHALAGGLVVTRPPPALSVGGLRLAASAVASLGVTSAAMLVTDLRHAPACATTLIVALGLLTTPVEAGVVASAVLLLVAVDRVLLDFGGSASA
jgi:hypothetical protein